jgi:hypothetical protein
VPDVGWVDPHYRDEPAQEFRLPRQVGSEVTGVTGQPIRNELWTLARVGGEQSGQPARHRIPAALSQFLLVVGGEVAEVGGQGAAPGLVQARVDDLQQRPGHDIRRPRILIAGTGDLGDQGGRRSEGHPGAHAVLA